MEKSLRAFARFSDGSLPVKPTLSVSAARCHLSQRESWRKAPERARPSMSRLPFPAELRPQPHHAERSKSGQHGGTDRDGQQAACNPLRPHIPGGGQGGVGALGQQLLQPGHSGRHPDAGRFLHVPPMNGIHRIHRRVNPQEVSFGQFQCDRRLPHPK